MPENEQPRPPEQFTIHQQVVVGEPIYEEKYVRGEPSLSRSGIETCVVRTEDGEAVWSRTAWRHGILPDALDRRLGPDRHVRKAERYITKLGTSTP